MRLRTFDMPTQRPSAWHPAEEFGEWSESARRIDLLGLDKQANLVVIELKRTEDGGHMELQAIRYAAMVSAMTFEQAVAARTHFQERLSIPGDPQAQILNFLEWDSPNEDQFAQDVRLVLVAGDFSKELTTSVIWLNDRDLDVRCVRLRPHRLDDRLILDVQQIIPLPEAAEYQVQVREKSQRARESRSAGSDWTRFDVTLQGRTQESMNKRNAMLLVATSLVRGGISPEEIAKHVDCSISRMWRSVEGSVESTKFATVAKEQNREGRAFEKGRFFCGDGELVHFGGHTYALSNQWGGDDWHDAMRKLVDGFPNFGIRYTPTKTGDESIP